MPVINAGKSEELQGIFEMLGLNVNSPTGEDWVMPAKIAEKFALKLNDTEKPVVPDVSGMPLRDALFILENKGLKVNYKGKGRVVEQSIAPGSQLGKNGTINLVLG